MMRWTCPGAGPRRRSSFTEKPGQVRGDTRLNRFLPLLLLLLTLLLL